MRLEAWLGKWALGRAATGAASGYTRHGTSQFAAAISYRILSRSSRSRRSRSPWQIFYCRKSPATRSRAGSHPSFPGRALDESVESAVTGSGTTATIAGVV